MAVTKEFRLVAWQVASRVVPSGELVVMTEAPKPQRVGQFPTLGQAMKAAACIEASLPLASIPIGPMLGEGRTWTFNPETLQLGREASTGVWLFGIKTVVVQTTDAKAAEAAKAAKAAAAQKAREVAKAAHAAEVKASAALRLAAAEASSRLDKLEVELEAFADANLPL